MLWVLTTGPLVMLWVQQRGPLIMLWVQQRGPNLETCDQWNYKPTTILGFDPVKGKPTNYFELIRK